MTEINTLTGKVAEPAPPAPTPAPQGAPAGKEPAPQGGNQEAAFRRLQQKMKAGEVELQSLREKVAFLEGKSESGQPPAPAQSSPKGWGDLSDAQLDQAIAHGISESKPETVTAAMNEKIARAAKVAAESARGASVNEYKRERHRESIQESIQREFGADAINEDSELYRAADRHYARFIATEGKDKVLSTPEFARQAFINADRELHAGERQKLQEAQQELEKVKRQMMLERGGVHPGVPRSQESADALAKGDLKGAIAGMNWAKSLKADVERRYR